MRGYWNNSPFWHAQFNLMFIPKPIIIMKRAALDGRHCADGNVINNYKGFNNNVKLGLSIKYCRIRKIISKNQRRRQWSRVAKPTVKVIQWRSKTYAKETSKNLKSNQFKLHYTGNDDGTMMINRVHRR
jgi:hypothetical protein